MTDLDGQIRAAIAELVESAPPPPPFPGPDRLAAARGRRLLVPVAAALAVVALLAGVLATRSGHGPVGKVLTTGLPPAGSVVALADDHRVVLLGPDGALLRTLAPNWGVYRYLPTPTVSRDGGALYLDGVSARQPPGCLARVEEVSRIALSDQSSASHVVDGISPAISPDGRWLAYVRGADACGGEDELAIRDLLTGRERVLASRQAPQAALVHFLSWAADSRHLAFESLGASQPRTVVRDTASASTLDAGVSVPVPPAMDWAGYLGATGDMIAVTRPTANPSDGQTLVAFDPATGTVTRTLVRIAGRLFDENSLDGVAQGVTSDRAGHNLLIASGNNGLYRWTQGDAAPVKLADHVVAAVWARDPAPPPPAPVTTIAPTSTTVSAAATQAGCNACTSVWFLDAQRGWAMRSALDQGPTSTIADFVVATADGGQHWSTIGQLGIDTYYIEFANGSDGWAWGTGLRATHDGGRTWTDEHPSGEVRSLTVVGNQVCALEGGSSVQPCPIPSPCPIRLWSAPVHGGRWQPIATPALLGIVGGRIVAPDPADAYIYVGITPVAAGYTDPAPDVLIVSHNQGRSWTALPATPCTGGFQKVLAAADGSHLWFGCGEQPYTFMVPTAGKSVYRSDDGGRHWRLVADTGPPSAGSPVRGTVGGMTDRGHLVDLVVSSPTTAWIGLGGQSDPRGGRVLVTRDGGHTWSDAADLSNPDDGFNGMQFVDSTHGWVLLLKLHFTIDGGQHWTVAGPG